MSQPLDDYLARVARELRSLPSAARENELREVRSHLEQLTQDFQTPNLALENAQRRAIEEFAAPRILGAKLTDAWEAVPFSWWRVVGAVLGITALYLASIIALALPIMILGSQPEQGLFPEVIPTLAALYASVPFGCGLLFSCWLGRRGRLTALIYFVSMFLILKGNASIDTNQVSTAFAPPDFFVAYVNAAWLPVFNVALGFLGSLAGHAFRMRTRLQAAVVGSNTSCSLPAQALPLPLRLKTSGWVLGFLGLCVSLFTMRIWLVLHPRTPVTTLRNSLIQHGGPIGFEPTSISEITELPLQTPTERAGRERRVHFEVYKMAKHFFAANQVALLKRRMAEEARSKYGVSPQTQAALARVQVNSQTVEATVRLIRTPQGWQIDEKSFDRSKLWSWFYVT